MYQVRFLGETSESFEVKKVLRKRGVIFPVLFNFVLEQVVRNMKDNGSMELVMNRNLLAHADDIVNLEESQH